MGNRRGIALMVVAMAAFALEDMFIKLAAQRLPTAQILLFLGVAGALVFGLWAYLRGDRLIAPAMFTRAMMVRNFGEVTGTIFFVTALTLVPLSTASAVQQATPLAVTLGAALFLGAPVGWRRWTAIAAGFAGVLIIVRPGMDAFQPGTVFAVLAVIALAMRDLGTRVAPVSVSSFALSTWGFGMIGVAGVVLIPFATGPVVPTAGEAGALMGALVFGLGGYYAITSAMRVGEVPVVAPFRYTRLLFAIVIGMLVFAERPDVPTLLGAALIIGSGLYTLARERQGGALATATVPAVTSARPLSRNPPAG